SPPLASGQLGSYCGAGFTALLSLALNLWYVNLLAFLLLTPGGLIQAFLIKTDSPIAILLANFVVYSALVFASRFSGIRHSAESRRVRLGLAFPVGVLVCLACNQDS